jgi:hypothetical protein
MPDFGSFRGFGEKLVQGQTPTQLGLIGSVGVYDIDAQDFFTRVTNAGGTLSAAEIVAVNQLVLDMKANGTWTPMKAIYPMVGASAAACAQNLKSSSFTGVFSGSWTYASTGVLPNGTNTIMTTGIIPSTDLQQNSLHMSYYSRTNLATPSFRMDMGSTGSPALYLSCHYNGQGLWTNINGATQSVASNTNSLGHFIATRTSATALKAYQNTTTLLSATTASLAPTTAQIRLGVVGGDYSVRECALASIGDGLTDTQANNFYTCVQTFQTTLSRQV